MKNEQPDFAEEKDVSEVEQETFGLHERRPQRRQEEKETVCPLDGKNRA
mgnify:CR=1 FL=1